MKPEAQAKGIAEPPSLALQASSHAHVGDLWPNERVESDHSVSDDELLSDALCEHLIGYDEQMARGTEADDFVSRELVPEIRAELESGLDCLRLLKELRIERTARSATPLLCVGVPPLGGEEARREDDRLKPGLQLDPLQLDPSASPSPPGGERETASQPLLPLEFGRFQLKKELGRGGFGVVFLAFDPLLNRDVALKLPRPDCLLTPDLRQRFVREGRAAAGLDHPNIVTVHEAGEIGGICYLATAYCPGVTLSEWLSRRTGPVPVKTAARLVEAIAAGLAHAHERGIVHRDLKPSNVLLQGVESRELRVEGQKEVTAGAPSLNSQLSPLIPKITDFGLAKLADATGDQTRTGIMVGTPRYMAPEQAEGRSHAVGPHTDVYTLGVILYELLTGTKPFVAASDIEVLRLIATADALAPRRLRREVPLDLETICLKCLEKDPRNRYPNAGELRSDLCRYLNGEPILARPAGPVERLIKWTRRRPATASLVALSAFALLSFIAAGAWHSHEIQVKNVDLAASVQEANEQRELALAGARRASLNAYVANIHVAGEITLARRPGFLGDALNLLRPAPGDDDLREFAWFYLWRLGQNERWLRGHGGPIHAVAFSADGRTLASASNDRIVMIWDASTGQHRSSLTGCQTNPGTIAISPDGHRIAVANSDTWNTEPMEVYVWDLHTDELLASLKDSAAIPGPLVFSPDSQTLALPRRCVPADRSGAVLLWKPETGQKRFLLDQSNVAMAVAFSPDGKLLAVAAESGSQNIGSPPNVLKEERTPPYMGVSECLVD